MELGPAEHRQWRRRGTALALMLLIATLAVPIRGAASASVARGQALAEPRPAASYDAYVPAAIKRGQFYYYSCEFDAAWVVLKTFGHEVPFEQQLAIVGHDTSVEPWYEQTADGFVIRGGDITADFNGDYASNLLARTTGQAMLPLFAEFGLDARPITDRVAIERTLDTGGLVWTKATVDFLPWEPTTWITPDGEELPTVLGNDHAVVVMGYDQDVVVIRDPLGPTDTNWDRSYEYEVPWDTFLAVWQAQGNDGLAVFPDAESAQSAGLAEPTRSGSGSANADDRPTVTGLDGIKIAPVGGADDDD